MTQAEFEKAKKTLIDDYDCKKKNGIDDDGKPFYCYVFNPSELKALESLCLLYGRDEGYTKGINKGLEDCGICENGGAREQIIASYKKSLAEKVRAMPVDLVDEGMTIKGYIYTKVDAVRKEEVLRLIEGGGNDNRKIEM
jgi:hypothetical protein